jgi:nitronate monooxygenase
VEAPALWSQNALTERLDLKWPILQAPMGSITTPQLAGAVSDAGGLGALGMWGFDANEARRRIEGFRQLSSGGLNVNYPLWPDPGELGTVASAMRTRLQALYDQQGLGRVPAPSAVAGAVSAAHLQTLLGSKPEVVSFHFGLPERAIVDALRDAGVFVISSATTVHEALQLEASGVNAVIAQGVEAGGHRGTFTDVDVGMQPGLFALLPQVVDAVSLPVIAAGAIGDGRGVAAAMMLGASAVQVGTAFLRTKEANVSAGHRAGLANAADANTVVTDVVSGRPARYVRNTLINALTGTAPLPFPAQMGLTAPLGKAGGAALTGVFAGQAARLARAESAGVLIERLAAEASQRLRVFV